MSISTASFIAYLILFIFLIVLAFSIWLFAIDKPHYMSSKIKRFFVWFLTVLLLPGILSVILTNISTSIWSPIHDYIVDILINNGDPPVGNSEEEFRKYVAPLSDETIQYSCPWYGLKIVLPDKYLCTEYIQASEKTPSEKIDLNYKDMGLNVTIKITDGSYDNSQSIEDYYTQCMKNYKNIPDIYAPKYDSNNPPYCVFSFNSNSGKNIYYELAYILDGIWCVTEFRYPTENREMCDSIITNYLKTEIGRAHV